MVPNLLQVVLLVVLGVPVLVVLVISMGYQVALAVLVVWADLVHLLVHFQVAMADLRSVPMLANFVPHNLPIG